jgi:hypothetical protein
MGKVLTLPAKAGDRKGLESVSIIKPDYTNEVKSGNDQTKFTSIGAKIFIGPTDGEGTIAKAVNIFTGGIDPDFVKNKTDVPSKPTRRTRVQVCKQVKDGTWPQIFGDFGGNYDQLCLSQDQIISFVVSHGELIPRTKGWGTLFLFKYSGLFSVASVDRNSSGIFVYMLRFWGSRVNSAMREQQIVIPQP